MSTDADHVEIRDDTFLIAVTITGAASRRQAREWAYEMLDRMRDFRDVALDSWWDASPDSIDGHDNGEAAWSYPGRGIEAQRALIEAGLAPERDATIGAHPYVSVLRNDRGEVICYECDRCNNASDHPAVLAEVPCLDLSKWEHAHLWVSDDILIANPLRCAIHCLSDCGLSIVNGVVMGEVSDDAAGAPPE